MHRAKEIEHDLGWSIHKYNERKSAGTLPKGTTTTRDGRGRLRVIQRVKVMLEESGDDCSFEEFRRCLKDLNNRVHTGRNVPKGKDRWNEWCDFWANWIRYIHNNPDTHKHELGMFGKCREYCCGKDPEPQPAEDDGSAVDPETGMEIPF